MLPTGEEIAEPAEIVRLAGRTFDDGYRLGRDRQLLLSGGRRRLSIVSDKGYPFAQVYAPEGQDFVALEPMTAPTDALVAWHRTAGGAGPEPHRPLRHLVDLTP